MKRILLIIATLCSLVTAGAAIASPVYAQSSDVLDNACNSTSGGGRSAACTDKKSAQLTGKNGTFAKITRIVAVIAGIAAIIVMMAGGLMFVTSNGDAGKAGTARSTILYAAIGLVIIALAQTIITVVVNRL